MSGCGARRCLHCGTGVTKGLQWISLEPGNLGPMVFCDNQCYRDYQCAEGMKNLMRKVEGLEKRVAQLEDENKK